MREVERVLAWLPRAHTALCKEQVAALLPYYQQLLDHSTETLMRALPNRNALEAYGDLLIAKACVERDTEARARLDELLSRGAVPCGILFRYKAVLSERGCVSSALDGTSIEIFVYLIRTEL